MAVWYVHLNNSNEFTPGAYELQNLGSWLDLQYEIYFLVKTLNQLVFLYPLYSFQLFQ